MKRALMDHHDAWSLPWTFRTHGCRGLGAGGIADRFPIEQVRMMRFTGKKGQSFDPIIDGHAEVSN